MIINILLFFTLILDAFAGRPVFHNYTRAELMSDSSLIFSGWPSQEKSLNHCPEELGRWWVHKVYKGDRKLEGKVIGVASHQYKIIREASKGKGVSYPSKMFRQGEMSFEQGTSILFANKSEDCYELTAVGAQEHRFKEAEIEALASMDCFKSKRALEMRFDSLPKSCDSEDDCRLYKLNPEPCQPPVFGNRQLPNFIDEDFDQIKKHVIDSCHKEWSLMGACAVIKDPPVKCQNKICVIGLAPKVLEKLPSFSRATIEESCAPHDDLAKMIRIEAGNTEYPLIVINLWGKSKPQDAKGNFQLDQKSNPNEFSLSFCPYQNGCEPIKKFDFKMSDEMLKFEIETNDGLILKGNVPISLKLSQEQVPCG